MRPRLMAAACLQVTPDELAGNFIILAFADPATPDAALDGLTRVQDVAEQAGKSIRLVATLT